MKFHKFIPRKSNNGRVVEGLGMMPLMVYMGLKELANKKGRVQVSYQSLSEFLGLSKSGVQKNIYKLEEAALIKRLPPDYETEVPTYVIL